MEHFKLYIDGQWIDTPEKFPVIDKYSGETFATIAQASKEQVDQAVRAARKSFETVKLTPRQRYEILTKVSVLIRQDKEKFAQVLSHEVGKPITEARNEVNGVANNFELNAEEAKRITGDMVPVDSNAGSEGRLAFTMRVPLGVVCAITPFNFPLSLATSKVAPALAAGNAVILKPTQQTPIADCMLVECLLKAGLPAGHIQLILGPGAKAGEWLLQNPDINFYSLTGSTSVGEHITRSIGMRRCAMELGSNAAVIVHNDVDIKKTATACAQRGFANAGQVCQSVQRTLVHKDVHDQFVAEVKKVAESLVLGNPLDEKTTLGPMINEAEVKRVDEWVKEAVAQGAKVVAGGKMQGTRFYLPTVLTGVKPSMKVSCQEVFGPIVVVSSYDNFDDAVATLNDSEYGLTAGVFTNDLSLMMKAAKTVETGCVFINDTTYYKVPNMPYGGVKRSGFGREGGKYAIREMTEERLVVLAMPSLP